MDDRLRSPVAAPWATSRMGAWLDRHAWAVFGLFAAASLIGQVLRARAKPFWHDEIYTVLDASLPTVNSMWQAAIDGLDLAPPLNSLLTRAVQEVLGIGHLTTRAVPMLGYLVMTAVIFGLLKARANTTTALSGALLPYFTAAYPLAYDARPYGLMGALFAISLFAWSAAARGHWRPWSTGLLAAALGASLWNHYYAILTFVPIAAGELVRTVRRRQFDRGVIGAMAAAGLAAVPLLPLAATARGQSDGFWASLTPASAGATLLHAYQAVLAGLTGRRAAVTGVALIALAVFAAQPRSRTRDRSGLPPHEVVAGLVAMLIPAVGIAVGLILTGVFTPRYGLSLVVGVSLVIPLALWWRNTKGGLAEGLLCAVLILHVGYDSARTVASPPILRDPYATHPILRQALASGRPVVVASGIEYLPIWYYAPSDVKSRLHYLVTSERGQKQGTFDVGYLALSRWTTVPVFDLSAYVADWPEMMVYVTGSPTGWLREVTASGAAVEEMSSGPGEQLLRVRTPGGKRAADASRPPGHH